MAQSSSVSAKTSAVGGLPAVRLELRHGSARTTAHEVADVTFLIGSVPGCDLRLPGVNLPAVLCLLARQPGAVTLRKLAPALPLLVNGQPIAHAVLNHGDRITLGAVDLLVQIAQVPVAAPHKEAAPARKIDERLKQLEARERDLNELQEQLETDRAIWYRRREQVEEECRQQTEAAAALQRKVQQQERELAAARAEFEEREHAFLTGRAEVEEQHSELSGRSEELARQHEELITVKREMAELRRQLYDRYRERRDRLAGVQDAVRKAARKVQERKRQLDAEVAQFFATKTDDKDRREQLEAVAAELARERQALDERQQLLDARHQQLQRELADRLAQCQERERKVQSERAAVDKAQSEYQADLARLHRLQDTLERRQKQLQQSALEIDKRYEQLQRDSRDLEEQATQLDEWHTKVTAEAEALKQHRAEAEAVGAQLAQRAAALEGQQAMLTTLRTRLERLREDAHRQETQLAEQRAKQDQAETDLRDRLEEARKLRGELDADKKLHDEERRQFGERRAVLDAAVAQLRQVQENLSAEEERLSHKERELEAGATELAEQAALVRARSDQIHEQQERVAADRQALKQREAALTKSEQALAALQEQLRRRSEELAAKQKEQVEQGRRAEEATAALEARQAEMEKRHQEAVGQFASVRQQIEENASALEQHGLELVEREQALARNVDLLKESGRKLGGERKALAQERTEWEADQQRAAAELAQRRAELESARADAATLQNQLPDLQERATAAADKLAQARTQLRDHLAEVHTYARQSREDLEALRARMQADAEAVRQQQLALHRDREEHRLAVAAFRQQLIDWHGHVDELKQSLAQGETRLERRQAEVAEQARRVDSTSQLLAQQAEALEKEQRVVAERRGEMERHLNDMRDWYRRKLRELAGVDTAARSRGGEETPGEDAPTSPEDSTTSPPHHLTTSPRDRDILTLTGDVEPGDRQLGDLMRSLQLVDAETLTALLVDARRQRRSLRQLLLAGGYLTLYQIALIEAGNVASLVLGPVRVIDRLRATPHEAVYRVFDPRSNDEAILRHLAEAEMHAPDRPDEFRRRFKQAAAICHPNVAATFELLEIAGRPAVLQEPHAGLPSTDWPPLAAAPGVWYRLVSQAALGLHAAHQAGLTHGHLAAQSLIFTTDGTLKIAGFGEPSWLAAPVASAGDEQDAAGDVAALGRLAASWLQVVRTAKRGKNKFPEGLLAIVRRLTAENVDERYSTAAALLEALDKAGSSVPANATAWERFLRQVRDESGEAEDLRKSA
jgi:chromosome segregation ATPase